MKLVPAPVHSSRRTVASRRPLVFVRAPRRIASFDHLRVFVIVLVILQHAAMGYCIGGRAPSAGIYTDGTAPVVDAVAWSGFNIAVSWTDGFFMPLMFLLSGLFVRPSLARKQLGPYLVDRALRLGVPLLVGLVTIVPLSYYAAHLEGGGQRSLGDFWVGMMTDGPWPSGPLWFVSALLVFDAALALLLSQGVALRGVHRLDDWLDRHLPETWFLAFVVLSALAYLPAALAFGDSQWITSGPFGIQASRVGLYFFSFAAGALVGAERLARTFDRDWWRWPVAAALATGAWFLLDDKGLPPLADGIAATLFSTATALGLLAFAVRFGRRNTGWGDSLSGNAYGIYLLHWPIVLWLQFALLSMPASAIAKGVLVLLAGLLLSWLAASLLRRLPGVARIV
jgi:glucan biosynthesis protein C